MGWIFVILICALSGISLGYDCGIPAKSEGSIFNYTGISIPNTILFYSCLDGYQMVGSPIRKCYENGSWVPDQPICERKNITCGPPGHGPHGTHDAVGHVFPPGALVNYRCENGFVLVGPPTRTCQYDGQWSYPMPFCGAKVSMSRRIASVSNNIDIAESQSNQGRAILDDHNLQCSIADRSDRVKSTWKVDLLELQSIDVIIMIFGNKTDVDVTIKVSQTNTFNETMLTANDYSVAKWVVPLQTRSGLRDTTTYEFNLKKGWNIQYITIELQPTPNAQKLAFCELLLVSKTAPSFGQCFSEKIGSFRPIDATTSIFNNSCYTFAHRQELAWATADEKCQEMTKGHLVTDVDVNTQIMMKLSLQGAYNGITVDKNFWIGGITAMSEKKNHLPWIWKNDHPIRNGLTFWGMNQPDMASTDPACLSLSGRLEWQWDDRPCPNRLFFICQHKILQCGLPDVPENTILEHIVSTDVGFQISYTCPVNYTMQGNRRRECLADGTWSGTAPFCFPGAGPERHSQSLSHGAVIGIVCGILLFFFIIIFIGCLVAHKKSKNSKILKISKQSESAETLDVHEKKGANYNTNAEP